MVEGIKTVLGRLLFGSGGTVMPQPGGFIEPAPAPLPLLPGEELVPAWTALPGGRLELGRSGFYVEFQPARTAPYWVFTPEHRLLAWGSDLGALKAVAEDQARYREAFEVQGGVDLQRFTKGMR